MPYQWNDQVIGRPGVSGGFQDHFVAGPQVLSGPDFQLVDLNPPGRQDGFLLDVDPAYDGIVLMQVNRQIAYFWASPCANIG